MKSKNNKKKSNHEADIENPNPKTKGKNVTYAKNRKNREKQLRENAEKKRLEEEAERRELEEKLARDNRSDQLNPNNPKYKGPKKE